MNGISNLFVDENEKEVAVLGSSFIQNFLRTGDLSKGFCAVSDKRVYFKGNCYSKQGNSYKATKEERTVDLKDITGTGFSEEKALMWLILACVLSPISFILSIMFCSGAVGGFGFVMFWGTLIIASVVSWILYFVKRKKLFEILFAGGGIAFKTSNYSQQETQEFQKALRIAKDNYVPSVPVQSVSSSSVADELKKYKELLDSGAISEAEYNNLKNKILK